MTEEIKRRGRQPKGAEAVEVVEPAAVTEPPRSLTFAEVMAWNRANAHLLAPAPVAEKPKRPKQKML